MCNPHLHPPKKVSCVGFKLDPAYFVVSYTSLRGAKGYFLLMEKWPCLSRWQGAAEYSGWGNISYIVKIWSLNMHEAETLDGYG